MEAPRLVNINYSACHMDGQALQKSGAQHFLFEPLKVAIDVAVAQGRNGEQIADQILRLLDRHRLTVYSRPDQIALLNTNGRILIAILEDPGITQRALAQYIGISENHVNVSVKQLLKNNLITKTKVKGRNTYSFNYETGLHHPDISRMLDTLLPYIKRLAQG